MVAIFVDPQRHTEILSQLGPKYLPRSSVGGRGAGRPSATPYDLVSFTKDSRKKKNKSVILPAKLIYIRCGNKILAAIACQYNPLLPRTFPSFVGMQCIWPQGIPFPSLSFSATSSSSTPLSLCQVPDAPTWLERSALKCFTDAKRLSRNTW